MLGAGIDLHIISIHVHGCGIYSRAAFIAIFSLKRGVLYILEGVVYSNKYVKRCITIKTIFVFIGAFITAFLRHFCIIFASFFVFCFVFTYFYFFSIFIILHTFFNFMI